MLKPAVRLCVSVTLHDNSSYSQTGTPRDILLFSGLFWISLSLSFCGFALSVYVLCVLRHCLALLLFLVFMAHFLHFPIFLAGLIFCPSFYFYAGSLSWLHRSKAILNWLDGKQGLLLWVVRTRTVVADGQSIYTGFLQLNVFLWSGTTTLVQTEILYLYYWIINHEIWYI